MLLLRNVVNADLFYLLALQEACSEGIAVCAVCPAVLQCDASANWFTLLRL
jgi:hypothetical protein